MSAVPAPAPERDPLRALRVLTFLSVAVPCLVYVLLGAYRLVEARSEAEQRVNRSVRVAYEHASKVISATEALQDRLFDAVQGKTLAELRAGEPSLHELLQAAMKDQPQIQSIWIIGADGRPVATSRFSPAPAIDYSDREYFTFHLQGRKGRYLSPPFFTRTTGERVLDISHRFDGPGGRFGGVINISLQTSYFQQFYGDLASDEPGLSVLIFRDDGQVYTRWPGGGGATDSLPVGGAFLQRLSRGPSSSGSPSLLPLEGDDQWFAFRRVGAYPVFVATAMPLKSVYAELAKEFAVLLALGLPPFGALFFTARLAHRRTSEAIDSAQRLKLEAQTRRRAEEALLQAQKLEAIGRLTGGVAHDFNNAMMVISNNVYLLKRGSTEVQLQRLGSISRAVDSATKLTRQLLAFSRRQALLPQHVRLQDKLPAVQDLIAPVLGGRVELNVDVDADTRPVIIDLAELELALLNLGINARDAMPDGGSFAITAHNAGAGVPPPWHDGVVIEARDSGCGIPAELLGKVFDPFFTTKPVGEGTGLGLSQVYGLCQRAGGTATIDSVVGRGTTVRLIFPAAAAQAAPVVKPEQTPDRELEKSVLVVEDNADVAGALVQLLEALGCQPTWVSGPEAARQRLAAHADWPDLVVTDVVMPGDMDGLALAQYVRSSHPSVPVLVMTGYSEKIQQIVDEGFEVLPKPCTPEALAAAIVEHAR